MGAYAQAARELSARDMIVIPVSLEIDNDGRKTKTPLTKWLERPLSVKPDARGLPKMIDRFGDAGIGLLTKPSRLTIVDIDDPRIVGDMVYRFGKTPMVTGSPSGGVHLWYQSSGEGCRNLRASDGVAVDVKGAGNGKGGLIVVPPSVRPDGKAYAFLEGDWSYLKALPHIKPGSLPEITPSARRKMAPEAAEMAAGASDVGNRNNRLFARLLKSTGFCATYEQLMLEGVAFNETLRPPLSECEVSKAVGSVWKMHLEGRVWNDGESRIQILHRHYRLLSGNSDALNLFMELTVKHGSHATFAVSPVGMSKANVIPGWGVKRYRHARNALVEAGAISIVHQGGRYESDASMFRFG